jgi:amino acid adenylation domain-containing protein
MTNILTAISDFPPEQQAIRDKCFHPTGKFIEFKKEEIEQSIPDRFEQMVRMYPHRIAVKTKKGHLTYNELNKAANRIAHMILAEQGSKAEPVGLMFEKGAPLISAMIGVVKAGKFFVLLDPSFPKARISAVLEDSQAGLVVTNRQNLSLANEVARSRCRLMEFESINGRVPAENLRLPLSPKALAFILYTSGSTGQPKGVIWIHRNVLHQAMAYANAHHICEHDRIALLTSGTSNTVTNTFVALLNGAALLPFDVQKEGVSSLSSWLFEETVSICFISSPLFRNLAETLIGQERFPHLRIIRLTSEAAYKADIDLYKQYFSPHCVLANGLSSTETGLLRMYLMDHKTEISGNEAPVGYPVIGKEILLLDDKGKEIGFNEVGEIAVRSRYLSPGYWRKPDLTKDKFRPDPEDGEKSLYLTGDLGLMLHDGCLVHKGRKDLRVKVRGYRVECTEVERALLEHAAIKKAVVMARQDVLGEARVVAYFTSFSQPGPSVSELRRFLAEKFPDYMIPSVFVMLDAIPLTPGGKVDRKALPLPSSARPKLDTSFVAPTTPVEKKLAQIWADVLSIDQVGIHDNFFDLGGHSLLATQVISRVINTFRVELPVQFLFESPTVADMAVVITENQAKKVGPEDLARMLAELEALSDEEARQRLADESK